jgi:hypothetical protein
MKFQRFVIAGLFVLVLVMAGYIFGEQKSQTVQAASIPQYSYAAYVFTVEKNPTRIWTESDASEQKTIQGLIDASPDSSIVTFMDLFGVVGWELTGIDKQGTVTLYFFKRPSQ